MVLTIQEKIERAEVFKNEGNELFKEQNYQAAMQKYHMGIVHLKGLNQKDLMQSLTGLTGGTNQLPNTAALTKDQEIACQTILLQCHNNLAFCHLRNQNWERALQNVAEVLKVEPQNAKALFRRGQARLGTNDLYKAREDFLAADAATPEGDPKAKKEVAEIDKALKKYDESQKKAFAKMFE